MGGQGNGRAKEWEGKGMGGQGNGRARDRRAREWGSPFIRIRSMNSLGFQLLRAVGVGLEPIAFAGTRTNLKRRPILSKVPPERGRLVRVARKFGCRNE